MKPIHALAVAVVVILTVGCSSPTDPISADGTMTLRFGQSVAVRGTTLSFTDVTDSRCPQDVVCAWEGDAAVRLESGNDSLVLHTSGNGGPKEGKLGDLTLSLLDVKPPRTQASKPVIKAEYVVTLRVTG